MMRLVRLLLLLLVCCGVAFGQDQKPAPAYKKIPLALSISGGTSLGAYEAGYCYYFTRWVKNNDSLFDLKVVTGTSAGSINALITFLSMAKYRPDSIPQKSLFYGIWSQVDFGSIRGPDTRLGLLDRMGLKLGLNSIIKFLEDSANRQTDCYLGITATRLNSYNQEVVAGLAVPTVKQQFIVHGSTQPDTPGGLCKWAFRNKIDFNSSLSAAVLPLRAGDSKGCDTTIRDLILASMGIPGLFQPLKIQHLQIIPSELKKAGIGLDTSVDNLYNDLMAVKHGRRISAGSDTIGSCIRGIDPDTAWFYVDGGLFNNSPIRLAHQIADSVFSTKRDPCSKAKEDEPTQPQADSFKYIYISAENTLYPAMQNSKDRDSLGVYATLSSGLTDWVTSAGKNELFTLKQEHPNAEKWLLLSRNYYPVYSRLLFKQFGFLEKDFRIFDFYLGMYDAQKFLSGDALDSMDDSVKKYIHSHSPNIEDPSFDTICHVLNGDAVAACSTNMKRLARVSKELYSWYWDGTTSGIAQKRKCAREFAAEVCGLRRDSAGCIRLTGVIKDTLENVCHVAPSRLCTLFALISSISRDTGDSVQVPFQKMPRKSKVKPQFKRLIDVELDSLFGIMRQLSDSIMSKDSTKSLCKMFGYRSSLCENYLEEHHRNIPKQAKPSCSPAFYRDLAADTSADSDFLTILNLLYDVQFQYSDMTILDAELHKDTKKSKWTSDSSVTPAPRPMKSAEVNQKIKLALSKLLRDYSNETGGPELERNIVNTLANPALGFISNTPPRWILYGAISGNGGEVGFISPDSLHQKFRLTITLVADSVVLGDAQPSSQGLTMPYRGPLYTLVGIEWAFLLQPLAQMCLGFRFGRNFQGFHNIVGNETIFQLDPSFVFMQRLRIGLVVATRVFDNERPGAFWSRGLTPGLNIGYEIFKW
jgi:predicted acylesterase/phospholipase RssA